MTGIGQGPPRRRSVGTSPEGLSLPPEVAWALHGAFGDPHRPTARPLDADAAVTTAGRLGLLSRLVHRLGPERLAADLGPDAAETALASYRTSALAATKLVGLARLVGRMAAEKGIRVVALKHSALCLAGVSSPAARGAADADLLVSDSDAPRLAEALVRQGLKPSVAPGHGHQHRPLFHPQAGMLELHRTIPGVRSSPGEPELRLETLAQQGLVTPLDPESPWLLVPRPHVLLAHALAHALYQHGLEPAAYAVFKVLVDAADLRSAAGDGLVDDALPLVAADVNEADARAAWALPQLLAAGGAAAVLARPESPEARLLAHFVRGALEPEYAESLKIRSAMRVPADRGGAAGLLRNAWHAVAINRAQARSLYGADTRAKYALALALRPFRLAGKLVRYSRAAARHRRA